jgi:hypothetical protein
MTGAGTAATDYTDAVAAVRNHADELGIWLGIWSYHDDDKPDALARRCAGDAVRAIDAAIAQLHGIRARLIPEIRTSDDAAAVRADALLGPACQSGLHRVS